MTSQLECRTDGNLAPDPEPEAQRENKAKEEKKKNRILQQHFRTLKHKTPGSQKHHLVSVVVRDKREMQMEQSVFLLFLDRFCGDLRVEA